MRASSLILIALTALATLTALPGTSRAAGEMTLEELIELVRQNELLYERIDFTIRGTYRAFGRESAKPPPPAPTEVGQWREVVAEDWQLRVVYQDPYFRMDRASNQVFIGNESAHIPFVCAFDGEKTRMLMDRNANISTGFAVHNPFPYPHTLVFGDMYEPLSILLMGHEAIASYPKRRGTLSASVKASYRGTEQWSGLRCHRVDILYSYHDGHGARAELWLAEDRNYIPARRVVYVYVPSRSSFAHKGFSEVREWEEIHPDIWFPSHIVHETYWPAVGDQEGNGSLNWRLETRLAAVSLNPEYPVSFFRVDFPAGTAVYEVESGKITRSYRARTPEDPKERSNTRKIGALWGLLGLLAACIAALLLALVRRRLTIQRGSVPVDR
jgi:hypothetical protein